MKIKFPKLLNSWKIWNNLIKKKSNIVIVISLIFILSILSGCIESENNINSSNGGEDFVFTTLDGNVKNLSDYRGKVVVLDLMGVACQPCQYEMFELKQVYENYNHNDLEIISIDVYPSETSQDVQSLIQAFKDQVGIDLDWTFGMDDGGIWDKYQYTPPGSSGPGVPTLYIFDQEGKIYFRHVGVSVFSEIPPGWPEDTPKLAPIINELLE